MLEINMKEHSNPLLDEHGEGEPSIAQSPR